MRVLEIIWMVSLSTIFKLHDGFPIVTLSMIDDMLPYLCGTCHHELHTQSGKDHHNAPCHDHDHHLQQMIHCKMNVNKLNEKYKDKENLLKM